MGGGCQKWWSMRACRMIAFAVCLDAQVRDTVTETRPLLHCS